MDIKNPPFFENNLNIETLGAKLKRDHFSFTNLHRLLVRSNFWMPLTIFYVNMQ